MNFRQVRKKIRTIQNVRKITRAMQMVAAVKMKKAQKVAYEGRPYQEKLQEIINRVLPSINPQLSPLLRKSEPQPQGKNLYIFISSNKGLCGGFNFNLFKLALKEIQFEKDEFIVLGKKAVDFILKMRGKIIADFSQQTPFADNVSAIFSLAVEGFLKGQYNTVYLFYNQFISTFRSEPRKNQLLPISRPQDLMTKINVKVLREYLIEPSPQEIIEPLLEDFLKEKIKNAILNSEAAEHSARMLAMKNATDNAADIIYNLTLLKNKLRQDGITNELLDIISAKQAVEGNL